MASDNDEKIRQRAYEIWQRAGSPEGRGEEHWAQAAREIEAESNRTPGLGGTAAKAGQGSAPPGSSGGGTGSGGGAPGGSAGASGISSGLQPGGAKPAGGPAAMQGSIGTGGGSTAGRASGSAPERKE